MRSRSRPRARLLKEYRCCVPYPDGTGLGNGTSPATSGWVDTDVSDGGQYVYIVYADNGLYCTPTVSGAVESKRPPGQARAAHSTAA